MVCISNHLQTNHYIELREWLFLFYFLEIRQIKKKDMAGSLVDIKKDGYGHQLGILTLFHLCSTLVLASPPMIGTKQYLLLKIYL